jgi:hypothetical protein
MPKRIVNEKFASSRFALPAALCGNLWRELAEMHVR